MEKKDIEYFKQELKSKKEDLEQQLKHIARKNPDIKGDYESTYPSFGEDMEDEATETEMYINQLPIEYALELRLKRVN